VLEAARFLPAPVFADLEAELGGNTVPSVAPLSEPFTVRAVPHTDSELIVALTRLEALGAQHEARARFWKTLRYAAVLLDQAVVRERIDQEFRRAVKRPGRTLPMTEEPSSS
jgi:hypothetical protein